MLYKRGVLRVYNKRVEQKTGNKKIVVYDGACPMCTVFAGAIEGSSEKQKFILHDMTKGELPGGLTKAAVEKEIHVIDDRGKVYAGAEGILSILETYPRLRFFVAVGRLPWIRHMLPYVYRFVAAHRHTLFAPRMLKFLRYVLMPLVFVIALGAVLFVVF